MATPKEVNVINFPGETRDFLDEMFVSLTRHSLNIGLLTFKGLAGKFIAFTFKMSERSFWYLLQTFTIHLGKPTREFG